MKKKYIIFLLLIFVKNILSHDYKLFTGYHAPSIDDYTSYIFSKGDIIEFSSGQRFKVEKNNGGKKLLTSIDTSDNIRIVIATSYKDSEVVRNYFTMLKNYASQKIPTFQIIDEITNLPEFVALRLGPTRTIDLLDFFNTSLSNVRKNNLSDHSRVLMINKLVDFAIETINIAEIYNFDPKQILWTGHRWVLDIQPENSIIFHGKKISTKSTLWQNEDIKRTIPKMFYLLIEEKIAFHKANVNNLSHPCKKVFEKYHIIEKKIYNNFLKTALLQ